MTSDDARRIGAELAKKRAGLSARLFSSGAEVLGFWRTAVDGAIERDSRGENILVEINEATGDVIARGYNAR